MIGPKQKPDLIESYYSALDENKLQLLLRYKKSWMLFITVLADQIQKEVTMASY